MRSTRTTNYAPIFERNSLKSLSQSRTAVFKIIFHKVESYNSQSYYSGTNTFWTIFNNHLLIKVINNINSQTIVASISSLFLYFIPNYSLLVISDVVTTNRFCFKRNKGDFITVGKYGGTWTIQEKKS